MDDKKKESAVRAEKPTKSHHEQSSERIEESRFNREDPPPSRFRFRSGFNEYYKTHTPTYFREDLDRFHRKYNPLAENQESKELVEEIGHLAQTLMDRYNRRGDPKKTIPSRREEERRKPERDRKRVDKGEKKTADNENQGKEKVKDERPKEERATKEERPKEERSKEERPKEERAKEDRKANGETREGKDAEPKETEATRAAHVPTPQAAATERSKPSERSSVAAAPPPSEKKTAGGDGNKE